MGLHRPTSFAARGRGHVAKLGAGSVAADDPTATVERVWNRHHGFDAIEAVATTPHHIHRLAALRTRDVLAYGYANVLLAMHARNPKCSHRGARWRCGSRATAAHRLLL